MKRMRWQIIGLVAWLMFVFNIERLDFDQQEIVNLSSHFYVLLAATVILFLWLPLRRSQMYLTMIGVLGIYAVFEMLDSAPSITGVNKYLTITEMVSLVITVGLAWLVNQALQDFMQAVGAISLPEGRPRLLSFEKIQERMRIEMGRARRHQHPMSVSIIELEPSTFEASLHQAVRDVQATMTKRYVQVRIGVFLAKHIRETDALASHTQSGRFLLLTPQTAAEQTKHMLARLSRHVEEQTGIRFRYSTADFPDAALTSDELLRKVAEELQNERAEPDLRSQDTQSTSAEAVERLNGNIIEADRHTNGHHEPEITTTHSGGNNGTTHNA